ncbi:tRNA-binding protein [Pseudalkalibacillus caeni]|uniref:tRNA-binding protein n=1 Tax=Exobacillus caeni TaxID=2574798 RepID=A0A5R9EY34_9BACL|nr:tRNA-binding protein [Pseudalkalibacillus caeni]TLS34940.1 tRNA-binding protein [Pseudalkalibacillus caeni]
MATFDDFMKLDIRVGEVVDVKDFPEARKPAYQLWVDLGDELGIKKSSAQITDLYDKSSLMGKQVIAVVNFPPMQIASFKSEILVMGIYSDEGVVLLQPDQNVKKGAKIG